MTSRSDIQDYVLRHFFSVYNVPRPIARELIAGDARLKWPNSGLFFFKTLEQFPKDVRLIKMLDEPIPVFFFGQSRYSNELLYREGETIHLTFDWISTSFYFLSGHQERVKPGDERSRLRSGSTFQAKYGVLRKPVVDYYFGLVRSLIQDAYNVHIPFRPEKPSLLVSHDIDSLRAGWKLESATAAQKRDFINALRIVKDRALQRYPTDNIPGIIRLEQALEVRATFFMLANKSPGNADYDIREKRVQDTITSLEDAGFEVAVHGSLGSHRNSSALTREKHLIPAEIAGNRFHYLHYDAELTCEVLRESGLEYDASLGFYDYVGFRHGYCRPFELWSWAEDAPSGIVEVPLHIMDTSYIEKHYLGLPPDEATAWTHAVIREVSRFRGGLSLLWHNNRFNSIAFAPWASVFIQSVNSALESGYKSERHVDYARDYSTRLFGD